MIVSTCMIYAQLAGLLCHDPANTAAIYSSSGSPPNVSHSLVNYLCISIAVSHLPRSQAFPGGRVGRA